MSVTVSPAFHHAATGLTSQRKLGVPFLVAAWSQALSLLLISGCSTSSHGERLFWSAQRLNAPIAQDPGRAAPAQFADAIDAFDQVIRQAEGTEWAARAHLAVGSLYAIQGQFERARDAYGAVLRDDRHRQGLCLAARVAIAKTYERDGRWDDAVRAYDELSQFHPWTQVGLEAPLAIATLYDQHGQPERALEARERAVLTYLNAISMAPTPEAAANARGYLALAYHQLGDRDAAVRTLEELAAMPSGASRPLVLLSLGSLASERAHHPSATAAKTRLEHLSIQLVSN